MSRVIAKGDTASRLTAARTVTIGASRRLALAGVLAVLAVLALAPAALAQQAWHLDSLSNTTVSPAGALDYLLQATNVGDAPMDGSEIAIVARLPPGMTALDAEMHSDPINDLSGTVFTPCTAGDGVSPVAGATEVRCANTYALPTTASVGQTSYQLVRLIVRADAGARDGETLTTTWDISGGGAEPAATIDPVRVATTAPTFGFDAFDGQVSGPDGNALTQAGGRPDSASVSIDFATSTDPLPLTGPVWPVEPVKDVFVDLPPGLIGNPAAADRCTATQLANAIRITSLPLCPPTSQVGIAVVRAKGYPMFQSVWDGVPVFNIVPPPNVPARFGFSLFGTVVVLDGSLRTGGDYGLTVTARNIPEALPLAGTTMTFWGVPAAAKHDAERACPDRIAPAFGGPSCKSGAALNAFLRNPTSCTAPDVGLPVTAHIDSWAQPGLFRSATFFSHLAPGYPAALGDQGPQAGVVGCERVPFSPTLGGQPSDAVSNRPSGFSFDLTLPQTDDPDQIAEGDLKRAVVTLPAGVRVSPSSAGGLKACAPSEIALRDAGRATCPDASKVAAVTIDTPLLDAPLRGAVFLAKQGDNPFGTLLALYIAAEGPGVVVKLAGRVNADPVTGRLTATFDDNPQTPFSNLHLQFNGGPRAPLVMPRACQTYTTQATLTSWSGRVVASNSQFTVSGDGHGGACPGPRFAPVMNAGTASNRAGSSSSLKLRFTRDDLDQEIAALTVDLPGGLTGRIADVDLCADAAARAGSCPAGSKIGDVTVGAGAGSNPFYITNGRAYLTGPYKSAPYGVSIVVPAVAGPFDLGNVVVRSALFVDKHTADVRVVSDPLPTILQGIPLQVRDVRVDVNKPGFFLNPTSCAEKRVTGALTSTAGLKANVSDRFQAADCRSLGFKPRMVMRVGGRGHTRRGQTSPFTTTLTMPQKNQANLRFVRVSLPLSINARLNTINDACTRSEFEADIRKCSHAVAGSAVASTPLLRDPLRGNVYFVKNGHPIPDLFVALRGQVSFDLIGKITIPGGKHLATTFATAPDVPIRSFTLRLLGGARTASIGAARNLCSASSRRLKAQVDYIAQNGRVLQLGQALKVAGCARHKAGRHRRR